MDLNSLKCASKTENIGQLKTRVSEVMLDKAYSTISFTSFKFKGFYRARRHNHIEGVLNRNGCLNKFKNESQFWEVPIQFATRGRCNDNFESIFYCASDIVTAILEVKPTIGEYISVGNFKNMFPNKDFQITPLAKRSLYKIDRIRHTLMKNFNVDKEHNGIEDFLDQLFCIDIKDEEDYKLSNAVSKIFLTDSFNSAGKTIETHGLIYPSIIRNQTSYCLALKVWVARCFFKLAYVQTLKIIEKTENSIKVKLVRNGNFCYEKLYPNDMYDVNWMTPPNSIDNYETLRF